MMPNQHPSTIPFLISITCFFCACAPRVAPLSTDRPIVVFPPPPDTTRIQFLTSFSKSSDVTGRRSGFARYVTGTEGEVRPILKPYGIDIHEGIIYVCDTQLGGLDIVDLNGNSFDYFQPSGQGLLRKPVNVAVDESTGDVFVADAERGQVVVFDPSLRFVTAIGDPESQRPTDVAVDGDRIWVSDALGRQIHVYSRDDFKHIVSFPDTTMTEERWLYTPTNLHVSDGLAYVTDFGDFRVKVLDAEGRLVRSIGGLGTSLGQFVRPKGLSVDREGNIYVVDAAFENVQVFDNEGRLLMFFGGTYVGPGYMYLPADVTIDYDNLDYFRQYVHEDFDLQYLILVSNQYGPDKISVYGFVRPKSSTAG